MICLYTCSDALYNIFVCITLITSQQGLVVTKRLSAVHRSLVDTCRTAVVWVVMLCIYYAGGTSFGEKWGPYSWLQLVGFIILVAGSFLYYGYIKLPWSSPIPAPASLPIITASPVDDVHVKK